MKIYKYPAESEWAGLLARPTFDNATLFDTVRTVLNDVKEKGDDAVKAYELKFDKVNLSSLIVTDEEIKEAESLVSKELKESILLAKGNIQKFHKAQDQELPCVETMPGVTCWQKAKAIEKVGLYIPGGTAPIDLGLFIT